MKLSPAGVEALKQYEGLSLTAYRDSGGVWTIGYGSTRDVREGMRISQAEADQRFLADTEWAQAAVRTDVVVPITQPQFDALVSLAYNIGAGAFAKSTLVRLLNAGDYRGAAEQFLAWNKVRGEVVTGLAVRRAKERAMFMEPAPIAESQPVEKPVSDTIQNVATVAGIATGNPWLGPALSVLRSLWPELAGLFAGPGSSEVARRNVLQWGRGHRPRKTALGTEPEAPHGRFNGAEAIGLGKRRPRKAGACGDSASKSRELQRQRSRNCQRDHASQQ